MLRPTYIARPLRLLAVLTCALVLGGVAVAVAREHVGTRQVAASNHKVLRSFHMKGTVGGLYPGARKVMLVRVRNRANARVRATNFRARVVRAPAGCPRWMVLARPITKGVWIHPRRLAMIRIRVLMKRAAPDACQGGRFLLKLTGRART